MTLQENLNSRSNTDLSTLEFLKLVHPNGPWTLTTILKNDEETIIRARTFEDRAQGAMAQWVRENDGKLNLYWQINPLLGAPKTNKARLEEVREVTRFHVDLDPRKNTHDREGERQLIRDLLEDEDWLRRIGLPGGPSLTLDSGNGYWAFWELARAIPIIGNEEGARRELAAEIGRHNRWIAELLNGALNAVSKGVAAEIADHCHNIDRISRLPGTTNIPDALKLAAGYKPEQAAIFSHNPERLYTADQFGKSGVISWGAGATASDLKSVEIGEIVRILPESNDPYEIGQELQRLFPQIGDKTIQLICLGEYVDGDEEDSNLRDKLAKDGNLAINRSRAHWRANRHMQHVGVPLNVILGVLSDERLPISAHAIEPIDEKTGVRGARRTGRALLHFNEIQIRKCATSLKRQQEAEAKAAEALAGQRPPSADSSAAQDEKADDTKPEAATPKKPPSNSGELVRELNGRHAVLLQEGGKTKVLSWERSEIDYSREVPVLQSFDDFRNRYMNRMLNVGTAAEPKWKPWGKVWLEHPQRREYLALRFLPGQPEVVDGYYNMWRGFAVEPKPGDWGLMQDHIRTVLANGDVTSADYILKWAAWAVQHPDLPAEAALVFKGGKGTGKGIFARAIKRLFGQHGLQITSPMQLTGRFNAHLRDCCLLFADEAILPDDKKAENVLKSLITEPEIPIEGKGVNVVQARNHLHVIMASNDDWVVPAGVDERRFAVFEVSREFQQDNSYFEALAAQMRNGGMEAMLHDLLAVDLDGWHPRQEIPQTEALKAQKIHGLDEGAITIMHILEEGFIPGEPIDSRANTAYSHVKDSANGLMDQLRAINPKLSRYNDHKLGAILADAGCKRIKGRRGRGWLFPPLMEMRAAWDATHWKHNWPTDVMVWGQVDDEETEEMPF